jgi:hypothetical protein
MGHFYTYAWLRVDRTPYYIGKGCGNRAYDSSRQFCPPPDRIIILKQNLDEAEAFKHEVYMIAVFGRKDLGTGILRNLTNGGDGCSGLVMSDITREIMSQAHLGKVYKKRKAMGPKPQPIRDKIGDTQRGIPRKKHDNKTKSQMSSSHTGLVWWVNSENVTTQNRESPGPEWQRGRKWRESV